jgi:pyruvate-formate lyase-activating enzyme
LRPVNLLRFSGTADTLILENLERLDESVVGIVVRVPLLTAFDDGEEDVRTIARFTMPLKNRPGIELLPHCALGRFKYRHLEKEFPMAGTSPHLRPRGGHRSLLLKHSAIWAPGVFVLNAIFG